MIKHLLLITSFALLAACSILPEKPALNYYGLILDNPPSYLTSHRKINATLRINPPTIAQAYETNRFYVRGNGERFYTSDVNRFLSKPNELIGESLRQWIEKTGPWRTVLSPNSIVSADYQMIVFISDLYADTRDNTACSVITMEVSVLRGSNNQLVFHRNFHQVTPLSQKDAGGLVGSYKEGLTRIFTELSVDLQKKFR